jgi:hypothetical protein
MKNKIFFILLATSLLISSCRTGDKKAIEKAVDGDMLISGKDTFDITVDTHTVISSERIPPRNVMEEGSPVWLNRTNLDSTYETRSHIQVGTKQVYKIAKKRK